MAGLEFVHVRKAYRDVVAVVDFSLPVGEEEFVVLVGPSGCGKSTLLKLVSGLEDLTGGEIYIHDRLVNYVSPKARDVAMVFQNYALYPHMTVADNIGFPLKMARVGKAEAQRRVHATAVSLGLGGLMSRRPAELSGGQRQRVAVGRAIVREPKVYLMDEPLSNLDAFLRVQMREELMLLHRRVRGTVVYVTHDQIEAMTMGDRIVVMNAGEIQQVGPPQAVYDLPETQFVATFIGSPAMNLFSGQVVRVDGSVAFRNDALAVPLSARVAKALESRPVPPKSVTLGVRSEDIEIRQAPSETNGIRGEIVILERAGADMFVRVALGDETCIVRAPARIGMEEGDHVSLSFNEDRIHIFLENQRNLFAEG